jgi:hypothetical protein
MCTQQSHKPVSKQGGTPSRNEAQLIGQPVCRPNEWRRQLSPPHCPNKAGDSDSHEPPPLAEQFGGRKQHEAGRRKIGAETLEGLCKGRHHEHGQHGPQDQHGHSHSTGPQECQALGALPSADQRDVIAPGLQRCRQLLMLLGQRYPRRCRRRGHRRYLHQGGRQTLTGCQ